MHTVHRKVAAIPPTSPSRALCQYFFLVWSLFANGYTPSKSVTPLSNESKFYSTGRCSVVVPSYSKLATGVWRCDEMVTGLQVAHQTRSAAVGGKVPSPTTLREETQSIC